MWEFYKKIFIVRPAIFSNWELKGRRGTQVKLHLSIILLVYLSSLNKMFFSNVVLTTGVGSEEINLEEDLF